MTATGKRTKPAPEVAPHPATLEPAGRKRRRKIVDGDTLVDAVLAVGFEKLTIEAVASHIDIAHSAIYHHVKDREALVELAMDTLMRRETWPAPGPDWRHHLDANGRAIWDLLERHPGLSLEITAQSAPSTALRSYVAGLCAHLEMLGFTAENAFLAVDLVIDMAFDVAIRSHFIYEADGGKPDGEVNTWYFTKLDVVLDGIAARIAPAPSTRRRLAPVRR